MAPNVNIEVVGEYKALQVRIEAEGQPVVRYVMWPNVDYSGQPTEVVAAHKELHTDDVKQAHADFLVGQETFPSKGPRRVGTPREFLRLFTDVEQKAFFAAMGQNSDLAHWWALASTGDFSLDHPSVAAGLSSLVTANILTEDRKEAILATDFNKVD